MSDDLDDDDGPRDLVELATLPEDHPMRNKPLGEIGAGYFHVQSGIWHAAKPYGLGLNTFNTLLDEGGPWTRFCKWHAPRQA